jgi:hypothetical protein
VAEGVDWKFEGTESLVNDPFLPEEFAVCFFFFFCAPIYV